MLTRLLWWKVAGEYGNAWEGCLGRANVALSVQRVAKEQQQGLQNLCTRDVAGFKTLYKMEVKRLNWPVYPF